MNAQRAARRLTYVLLGNLSLVALLAGAYLLATAPAGALALAQGGRLTELGCYALLAGILGTLGALYAAAPILEPALERLYSRRSR